MASTTRSTRSRPVWPTRCRLLAARRRVLACGRDEADAVALVLELREVAIAAVLAAVLVRGEHPVGRIEGLVEEDRRDGRARRVGQQREEPVAAVREGALRAVQDRRVGDLGVGLIHRHLLREAGEELAA